MIDLDGKTVVPGFTDSHCHIFGVGEREVNLNLEETNALENFVAKVKERVAKTERDNGSVGAVRSRLSGNLLRRPSPRNSESWLARRR
jgi:predicted amidohydrolase YtcJ